MRENIVQYIFLFTLFWTSKKISFVHRLHAVFEEYNFKHYLPWIAQLFNLSEVYPYFQKEDNGDQVKRPWISVLSWEVKSIPTKNDIWAKLNVNNGSGKPWREPSKQRGSHFKGYRVSADWFFLVLYCSSQDTWQKQHKGKMMVGNMRVATMLFELRYLALEHQGSGYMWQKKTEWWRGVQDKKQHLRTFSIRTSSWEAILPVVSRTEKTVSLAWNHISLWRAFHIEIIAKGV